MLFNSYIFLLFFFPVCLIGYFALNRLKWYNISQAFLLGMSLWFYGYFNISYLYIIVGSIVINFLCTRLLYALERTWLRRLVLAGALLLNLGVLFYYKYFNFFLENMNEWFRADFTLREILLPLGISFFTFQQVSYVIDVYRREVPKYPFLQYACFVAYFPQLIAGPIVTHDELVPQFLDERRKRFNWENFSPGIHIFALGLAKKVLIADVFGKVVTHGFGNLTTLTSTGALLTVLAYTFQIYFDFSGYCDMAIGLGKMMNIDLPINFDSPYKALNITEFWQRWHKTLTRFFTKYIYIPLGGNRKGLILTCVNVMVVFLVSGLWHGANWTFILWGCMHGVFCVLHRLFRKVADRLPGWLTWLMTFLFLNLTWVFFRADSIGDALALIKTVFGGAFSTIPAEFAQMFQLPEFKFLLERILVPDVWAVHPNVMLQVYYIGAMIVLLGSKNAAERMRDFRPSVFNLLATAGLLVWCIMSFSGVSTFLYFNF